MASRRKKDGDFKPHHLLLSGFLFTAGATAFWLLYRAATGDDPSNLRKLRKYDPEQITKGTLEELEHTDDWGEAQAIAIDHLDEDPQYYSKLSKAGLLGE